MRVELEIPDTTLEIIEEEAKRRAIDPESVIQIALAEYALKLEYIHGQNEKRPLTAAALY